MDVGNRNLRRGNKIRIQSLEAEQVFFEFGKLARTVHAFLIHNIGRKEFRISVSVHMQVEHEVDQGSLQSSPQAPVESEAGARYLGGASEIQNSQILADIPVGFGGKGELGLFSPSADLRIVRFGLSDGYAVVGQIRDHGKKSVELLLDFPEVRVHCFDPLGNLLHLTGQFRCVLSGLFHGRDLFRGLILTVFEGFHFLEESPAVLVQTRELIKVHLRTALTSFLNDEVQVISHEFDVEHVDSVPV